MGIQLEEAKPAPLGRSGKGRRVTLHFFIGSQVGKLKLVQMRDRRLNEEREE
jgi:hypothetical protein